MREEALFFGLLVLGFCLWVLGRQLIVWWARRRRVDRAAGD